MPARTVAARSASNRPAGGRALLLARLSACALTAVVALLLIGSPAAHAESLCTDTWTGPAEGWWSVAADWSAGKVPSSTDVACIGSGKTVKIEEGTNVVSVVQGEGALVFSGGVLEIASALEVSKIGSLTMRSSAKLTGAGTLEIGGSFSAEGGQMRGSGSTVLLSGASGSIDGYFEIYGRSFANEGTITSNGGAAVFLYEGVKVSNSGTFKANAENSSYSQFTAESGGGSVVNTGLFEKTEGSGRTNIAVPFENNGTVAGNSGTLLLAGSLTLKGASSLEGTVASGENVTVTDGAVEASAAKWTLGNGSKALSIESSSSAKVGTLVMNSSTTVSGAGRLEVSGSFNDEGGKMTGTGATVVLAGASGSVEGYLEIHGRSFVNEGTITSSGGSIFLFEHAQFKNAGTFKANSEGSYPQFALSASEGSVLNTGTLEKTAGSGTTSIGTPIENEGTIAGHSGTLALTTGTLKKGSELEGSITLDESTVFTEGKVEGQKATVKLTGSASLSADSGSTATIGTLIIKSSSTTVTGAGKVAVSKTLTDEGGKMTGAGSTVVLSGATGTVTGYLEIYGRTLVNEGTVTAESAIFMHEEAQVENTGTFKANTEGSYSQFERGSGSTSGVIVNRGLFEKTAGSGEAGISVAFENDNEGTAAAKSGSIYFGSLTLKGGSKLEGPTTFGTATVRGGHVDASAANATVQSTLNLESGGSATVGTLHLKSSATITGAGTVDVSSSFLPEGGKMTGSGSTVVLPGATGTINGFLEIYGRPFINEGTVSSTGSIFMYEEARVENAGTFKANTEGSYAQFARGSGSTSGVIVNRGLFEKTAGTGTTYVEVPFENRGTLKTLTGKLVIERPISTAAAETQYGTSNPSAVGPGHPTCGKPVDCITGNETETQTDIEIAGRGVGLNLTRYYNAQAAAKGEHGAFGYGWSNTFSDHLVYNEGAKTATVVQANGSAVAFSQAGSAWQTPAWTQDKLTGNSSEGYTLTLADQTVYKFSAAGQLESVADRNGNTTSLSYNEKGQLATITDPSGRTIKLAYNGEGLVETATDPMGHVVKYTYESGSLASVKLPGESSPRWQFKYDGSHRMTSMVNGIGGETTNTYNGASQVTTQKEPSGATLKWEYEAFQTKITNESTTSVTLEEYNSADELTGITHGYGTEHATTETFTYNEAGEPLTHTDGNEHTTSYEYDGEGNKVKQTDAEGHITKWAYNSKHEITSETLPSGETTSIEYDEHGNPTKVSRPAPKEETQETRYEYNAHGEMTAMIDPLSHKWVYEYDEAGDRTSETNPEGNKTTWAYNEDSQQTSEVSPAGNVEGGKPAEYTTTIERNTLGEPVKITRPEGKETSYEYNADGDQTAATDPNGHKTEITYNSEDQPTKVKQPSGATQETEYNGAGQVIKQIDGNKHATSYARDVLGQVTEETNPTEHKTKKTYDTAGNLETLTDAAGRTATYSYNKENQLTKISYSEAGTHTAEYEYTPNGQLSSMSDGTGTTSYTYDQLGRLTETKDGHGNTVGYGYDLANDITKITYPNGKIVKDSYDKAGRLTSVADWLSHTISFAYTPNSQVATETFPEATSESDHYTYARAGELTETKMLKGSETLASILYKRDNLGQVTKATQTGLPGAEATEYAYTTNEQLEKAGSTSYEYDAAGNPTKIGAATNTFNAADQLTEGGGSTYTYNETGQRTKATPTSGPATTYGYDQAGNLTTIKRPEEGETTKIEDSYTYNGNNLRTSETINGTTHYLTWQQTSTTPLLLSDGSNSYIYGPEGPIEQINSEEHATYLHHDQQGSTRLLTNEKGETTGSYTYGPYGTIEKHEGTATTQLGYDGQLTSSETGLIYLRARTYDPNTAQFLSVDPEVEVTHQPYTYTEDNPVNGGDPTGLCNANPFSESFWTKGNCISENTGQVGEAAAIGVCVVASGGYCLGAAAAAYGYNTFLNADNSCGFSWGEQALITATAGLGAAPGLSLEVPQFLGLADEAPAGANAFLAGPGAIIVALEKKIKRELLNER
jgi:RHS repeat-associated protein